jgi:3-hydroxyisobutyrate dehydrogenase-like beta-hydroxyacid dehydrogenase
VDTAARRTPTVGILYPGEMGTSLGRILRESVRVVTTVEGRSPRTQQLCREAELETLPTMRDVVCCADVVVSVVPPASALQLARDYAKLAGLAPAGRLYVDVNAVSPATAVAVGRVLEEAGVDYVDAAINGLAARLRNGALVYLSGPRAAEVAAWWGQYLTVQVIGETPGKASALKGVLAGLSKGLTALFAEIAVLAHAAGVSEPFLERCRSYYRGVTEVVDRMLPTYPQHARRRAEEMAELEEAMLTLDLEPTMVRAAHRVTARMAEADLPAAPGTPAWTADEILKALHARGALRLQDTPNNQP